MVFDRPMITALGLAAFGLLRIMTAKRRKVCSFQRGFERGYQLGRALQRVPLGP